MPSMVVREHLSRSEVDGRVLAVADAGGRAGEEQVARLEGDELARVGDQVGGREHELRRATRLSDHAVDLAADGEIGADAAELVRG